MPNINTLMKDIDNMLAGIINDGVGPDVAESVYEEFGRNCAHALRRQLTPRVKGSNHLRLSALGKCQRALWFEEHGVEPTAEKAPGSLLTKFLLGDLVEELTLAFVKAAGHTVEREQEEVTLETENGMESIKGHIDCIIDGHLVDVKSASSYSFKSKFKEGGLIHDDAFGYLDQLAAYASALDDVPVGGFLAVDKQHGEMCLYNPPKKSKHYAPEKLTTTLSMLHDTVPPANTLEQKASGKSGNTELPINCFYCKLKRQCYKEQGIPIRIFKSSTGPKYLSRVVREPRMEEITWDDV